MCNILVEEPWWASLPKLWPLIERLDLLGCEWPKSKACLAALSVQPLESGEPVVLTNVDMATRLKSFGSTVYKEFLAMKVNAL